MSALGSEKRTIWPIALACFAVGCGVGFGTGVLTVKEGRGFLVSLFQKEQSAAVRDPTTVDRPTFRFQYAGNWKIDTADSDYDADHSFSVDSPGESFVMFQIADAELEPRSILEHHVDAQTSKLIKNATRTSFTRWGEYDGEGAILKGKLLGITPGRMRIFCFRRGERTFTVIEQTFDEDEARVAPGFSLIERTFRVKAD